MPKTAQPFALTAVLCISLLPAGCSREPEVKQQNRDRQEHQGERREARRKFWQQTTCPEGEKRTERLRTERENETSRQEKERQGREGLPPQTREQLLARVDRDRETFQQARTNAEAGHSDAQFLTGLLLWNGRGVAQNTSAAVDWWRTAARKGHVSAASALGFAYSRGVRVPQNDKEAARWHRVAALGGDGLSACETARTLTCEYLGRARPGGENGDSQKGEAYFWYIIGTSRMWRNPRQEACIAERDELRRDLSEEVAIAVQARAAEWSPSEGF